MRNQLRLAWRVIRRRPVLSAVIALTIGGALAATTVAFAVVNGVLLRPLPYAEPDRLVVLWERSLVRDAPRNVVSPANYFTWQDELRSVSHLTPLFQMSGALSGDGEPEQVGLIFAGGNYFSLVGAVPLVGRLYGPADDVDGAPNIVVMSEGLWRRRFGADPSIVGKTIQLNGSANTVIGILPTAFDFKPRYEFASVGSRDLWTPPRFAESARTWGGRYLQIIGRLTPGATVESLRRDASALAADLRTRFPDRQAGWDVTVASLHDEQVGDVRTPVWIIFGAVSFVLLIACANVANLLLGRAAERQQEMAVRSALGGSRADLFRQLLSESAVLVAAGAVVGLVLASWGIGALVAAAPDLPRLDAIRLDARVIGFGLGVAVVIAVMVGLAPALELSGSGSARWLTQRGDVTGRRQARKMRNLLVATQIALSFTLLVGAGLLLRSLANRLDVSLGLDAADLVTGELSLPSSKYGTPELRELFYEQLAERLGAIPGVERASLASIVPMSGNGQATGFRIVDAPPPEPGQEPVADVRFVHHAYHETMRIPLLAGEYLDGRDRRGAPVRVLINETGARQLWPGESAVGKRITMDWNETLTAEVAGVVADVRLEAPDQPVSRSTLYWDYRQLGLPNRMVAVVRTRQGEAVLPAIRAEVAKLDPVLPLYNVRTMETLLGSAVARARFTAVALAMFAGLALALAALGVYGVMAYATQLRTREIGVRLALGADRAGVVRMVVREGAQVVVPALLVGGVAAVLLSRFLRSLVFGVSPSDPVTLGGVALLLGLIALGACWLPARRAGAIDPVEAIRNE